MFSIWKERPRPGNSRIVVVLVVAFRIRVPRREKTQDDNEHDHKDDYWPALITTTTGR
jgi:hypothetical protein